MQAISDALERLRDDASWFARAHELRLLTVHAAGDLRGATLSVLAGMEFHHDNPGPWVVLEDAHLSGEDGWATRQNRLLAHWEARREAYREREAIELPAARMTEGDGPAATRFGQACRAVIDLVPEPMRGLVIVLAPTVVEDVEAMGRELEALLDAPSLAALRVVWVLDEDAPSPTIAARADALESRCVADPDAKAADVRALLDGGLGAGAGPGVTPPRRVDAPPELPAAQRDAALRDAGVDPRYPEVAPELGRLTLEAPVAMKEGRPADAVRLSREARDLAASLAMPALTAIQQVTLATHLSASGADAEAVTELEGAIRIAKEHDLGLQEAQARLALGLIHAQHRRWDRAAHQYAECARRAESAGGLSVLAIEGWRLAGQLALTTGHEEQAVKCFHEAIRVAEWSEPEVVQTSSGPEAARRLAEVCRGRGLASQADSLEETAVKMEAGDFGTPFEDAPTVGRGRGAP